jgi:hypothetical protein
MLILRSSGVRSGKAERVGLYTLPNKRGIGRAQPLPRRRIHTGIVLRPQPMLDGTSLEEFKHPEPKGPA